MPEASPASKRTPSTRHSPTATVPPVTHTVRPKLLRPRKPRKPRTKKLHYCDESDCGKSFTTSGHLARHKRIHSGVKPYPCPLANCPSRFSRQDNMMQHYRTHVVKIGEGGQTYFVEADSLPLRCDMDGGSSYGSEDGEGEGSE
ncbi:transcriptional repressor [Rhizophlyctis rosea]|nr:transcriptional repressor [Rhizophlyctis rosea]